MPFDRRLANKIRRQARTKLTTEFSLRDPDLRRLVGHANLLDDLLIRTTLAVRGWDEEDYESGEVHELIEEEMEEEEEEMEGEEEGEGVRLYEDQDGEDHSDDDTTDDDTESDQDSDDSSDDDEINWWDQPLVGTVIEAASACGDKGTSQVVKTAEEVIAIAEVIEGFETDVSEEETPFLGPRPSCSPRRLDTIAEMDWDAEETRADAGKLSTPASKTRLLTRATLGGPYGTFGTLDPVFSPALEGKCMALTLCARTPSSDHILPRWISICALAMSWSCWVLPEDARSVQGKVVAKILAEIVEQCQRWQPETAGSPP